MSEKQRRVLAWAWKCEKCGAFGYDSIRERKGSVKCNAKIHNIGRQQCNAEVVRVEIREVKK